MPRVMGIIRGLLLRLRFLVEGVVGFGLPGSGFLVPGFWFQAPGLPVASYRFEGCRRFGGVKLLQLQYAVF